MHLQEKTLTSDVKYEGVIFTITHDTAELENGKTAHATLSTTTAESASFPLRRTMRYSSLNSSAIPFRR